MYHTSACNCVSNQNNHIKLEIFISPCSAHSPHPIGYAPNPIYFDKNPMGPAQVVNMTSNMTPTIDITDHSTPMSKSTSHPTSTIDLPSQWRAWQALSIIYTVQLNHQIRRRWLLEQTSMKDKPVSERFRPVIFLETVPTLTKPPTNLDQEINTLRTTASLLRARVEKGKELASEIERRMLEPRINYPTHFCHTCVEDGERVEVLLTKCGHRVCRTCLEFGIDGGVYECSICFREVDFVARSPYSRSPGSSPWNCSDRVLGRDRKAPAASRGVRFCSPIL
ncbi:unnamed protein product [Penicillium salamii]|uniref:RING-type domain-containing protein n=1 Tax=Penicillium salamii TaxID=1612424 RepID=A0A9W4NN15_9EURO|nr:unnamed protein product [Penicillium salamii]CAG8114491.1 unnamed protein product [Penicillium salamii]CAG8283919.1 unnamed protein product [Penicillium salamii]CAG8363293.1 unnamed protein product [Penicillium salamii]CAG8364641.1 unnamed protein product [Penicillium salamii]